MRHQARIGLERLHLIGQPMSQTLHSLLRAVGLPWPDQLANVPIEAITCDSRCVSRGSLFLGLPGVRVDGGSFWPRALADGAAAARPSGSASAATSMGRRLPRVRAAKRLRRQKKIWNLSLRFCN